MYKMDYEKFIKFIKKISYCKGMAQGMFYAC